MAYRLEAWRGGAEVLMGPLLAWTDLFADTIIHTRQALHLHFYRRMPNRSLHMTPASLPFLISKPDVTY